MPQFIASRIRSPSGGTGPSAALGEIVADLSMSFAARRDIGLARQFLADKFGETRFWLYGAGTHSAALLAHFADAWATHLAGIVDRDPAGRTHFCGFAIHGIPDVVRDSGAPILVAHPFFESAMADGLRAAGVEDWRIHHLYLNPDFIELSRTSLAPIINQVPAVILGSTRYITVSDGDLAQILDPAVIPYLAFDLFEQTEPRPPFTLIPMDKSVDAVVAALESLRPRLVYLRTKMETDFLAYLVRQVLPDCILVHELWDFSVVFEDRTLVQWLKFPAAFIEASRLAECWSVRESDLILSKWGGKEWAQLFDDGIGTELFFGGIGAAPPPLAVPRTGGVPRVLYAGLLPKPEDLSAMPYDYNFLGRLERLAQSDAAEVTILNSGHECADLDETYRDYVTRFAAAGIRYGRRVAYVDLMSIAAEHDFGWLALDEREEWDLGKRWLVPMRFTGYVQAGLPIVISEPWGLCVDLVERFSAGIVLEDDSDLAARRALREANPDSLRRGVRELHAQLRQSNLRILTKISNLLRA